MVKYASVLASYISYICRNLGGVWLPFILMLVVRSGSRQNSIFLSGMPGGRGRRGRPIQKCYGMIKLVAIVRLE